MRGSTVTTEELPAYCAVALAGLDDLPDTIGTRSVIVRMRRRAPGERIEPWRARLNRPEAQALCDRLVEWSHQKRNLIEWPEMPPGIEDRPADVWEALLAVADLAGGHWPQTARVTAVTTVTDRSGDKASLGVQLLCDLRGVFANEGRHRLPTTEILAALNALEESPWGNLRGAELDARGLARRLSKYGVRSTTYRDGDKTFKGYDLHDDQDGVDALADVFDRYLPTPGVSITAVTTHTEPALVTPVTDVTEESAGPAECASCQSPMLLRSAGRTTCERCRLDQEAS